VETKKLYHRGEFKGKGYSNLLEDQNDLTQTTLAEGDNFLDIDCVSVDQSHRSGRLDIRIMVKTVMAGGFVDKRSNVRSTDTTEN